MKKIFLIIFLLLFFQQLYSHNVGEVLPQWSEGYLDIHHINTGKGECVLCILPDGTTLLIDAGATNRPKPRVTDPRPDGSKTPGEWITRYINHMLSFKSDIMLDYVLLSHFHDDHMGSITDQSPLSQNGNYRLSGLTEVGDYIPIKKLVDRAWPDYNYPYPLKSRMIENYRQFLDWHMENTGLIAEKIIPGSNEQFLLKNDPATYPGFEIRNVAANGEVWTGVANNTRHHFPPIETLDKSQFPSENMCSSAIKISYGSFDYFNGGDITGVLDENSPVWRDVETPVAKAVGPVEVNELNHHGYTDSENAFFVSTLAPQVHILQVWSPSHPTMRVLRRLLSTDLYPGPRDIFATNMMQENNVVIGSNLSKLKSDQGHILVRVEPGGDSFHIIILDDAAESYKVKSVHGPYKSR